MLTFSPSDAIRTLAESYVGDALDKLCVKMTGKDGGWYAMPDTSRPDRYIVERHFTERIGVGTYHPQVWAFNVWLGHELGDELYVADVTPDNDAAKRLMQELDTE